MGVYWRDIRYSESLKMTVILGDSMECPWKKMEFGLGFKTGLEIDKLKGLGDHSKRKGFIVEEDFTGGRCNELNSIHLKDTSKF